MPGGIVDLACKRLVYSQVSINGYEFIAGNPFTHENMKEQNFSFIAGMAKCTR